MSDTPPPSTYVKQTIVIALVLVTAMLLFLRHEWF